jgi:C4-dicarboxylate-specific signal transduction histidine kinase/ActR/RegA family two-component response regulator
MSNPPNSPAPHGENAPAIISQPNLGDLLTKTVNFVTDTHLLSGESFLLALVGYLYETVGAEYVLVGQMVASELSVATAVFGQQGQPQPNFIYELAGTPCANVIGHQYCLYAQDVAQLFPQDHMLAQMSITAYAGVPLWDSAHRPLGLIALLNSTPFPYPDCLAPVLNIVALRVGTLLSELKHQDMLQFQRDLVVHLAGQTRLEKAFATIIKSLHSCTEVDNGALYLLDNGSGRLVRQDNLVLGQEAAWAEGNTAVFDPTPIPRKPTYHDDPDAAQLYGNLLHPNGHAQALIPIWHNKSLIGLLYLSSHRQSKWGAGTRYLLENTATQISGALSRIRDHEELRFLQEAVHQRNRDLERLNQAGMALGQSLQVYQVVEAVVNEAQALLETTAVALWLPHPQQEQLICSQATINIAPYLVGKQLHQHEGLAGTAWATHEDQISPANLPEKPAELSWLETWYTFRTAIAIPLLSNTQCVGVLTLFDERPDYFRQIHRQQLLDTFASMAASDLQNAYLHQNLQQQLNFIQDTQQRLIQNEKLAALGELVAGVAHELNNPLAAIILHTELLERRYQEQPLAPKLKRISQDAHRAANIVRHLLDFARQRHPKQEAVSLNDLIMDTLEIVGYNLHTRNIEVITQLQPNLPLVLVDFHQIQQVLVNLITNAQHALEQHPSPKIITIASYQLPPHVEPALEFVVSDNGPGIPPEYLSRIFDPFFTTKDIGEGTGLGLAVCHGIVTEHGGEIKVQSQLGHGASFTVRLPLNHVPTAVVEPIEPPTIEDAIPSRRGEHILLLDDEDNLRYVVASILELDGYEVTAVDNGRAGLEQLHTRTFDLIICDLNMPGLNGQEFYQQLRQKSPSYEQRILFITGDSLSQSTSDFLQKSGVPCLHKPFDITELLATVEQQLAQ